MAIKIWKALTSIAGAMGLVGCTGIPLDRIQPEASSGTATCPTVENVVGIAAGVPGATHGAKAFTFVLPASLTEVRAPAGGPPGAPTVLTPPANPKTFDDFVNVSRSNLAGLPPAIRNHSVTDAIFRIMVKSSAQAQINRANVHALPAEGLSDQEMAVKSFTVPTRLTTSELKDFADKVFDEELHPAIAGPAVPGSAPGNDAFATYFTAYYENHFYDRFGQPVAKPNLSLTIPDTEIAAALTVLIEYIADLVDPTPVLGDQDVDPQTNKLPSNTKFYPGGGTNEPTALVAQLAKYKNIGKNQCGVTPSNASVLEDVANAAGDRAGTISGLVSQSWGGVSFGLGVLGKFSFGDNQTLGTVVKTAATRLGTRISFAASYWALDSLGSPPVTPGPLPPPSPPGLYLRFEPVSF